MTHSTTAPAPARARKNLARPLASALAASLVAGALALGAAAPASAAVTGDISNASLSWGFQTGANGWRIVPDDVTPIDPTESTASYGGTLDPYTTAKGFTLSGGAGVVDRATGVSTVDFPGSVTYYPQWSYGTMVPDQPWISFADFQLTTESSDRGSLTAVVDWYKDSTHELAGEGTRVEVANFDIGSFATDDGLQLTTAAPDWVDAVPIDTYAVGYSDAWPVQLNDLLLPKLTGQDIAVYFQRTGNTSGNNAKAPLPITVSASLATPVVTATVTSSTPTGGVVVQVAGDGFRGVTKPGDAGIYIGVTQAGGLPDVSTPSGAAAFVGTQYLPAALLSTGTFSRTLTVPASFVEKGLSYSVYTWQAHTHSNTSQDTETPIAIPAASIASHIALSAAPAKASSGATVGLTATAPTGATGSIEFFDGSASLGTVALAEGVAKLTTPALAARSHSFSATYGGDVFYLGSTASTAVEVSKFSSSVRLALGKSSVGYGSRVTATATVTPAATGTVTFTDGAKVLGTAGLVGGSAKLVIPALAVGKHSIVASYAGDATTASAKSATAALKVAKASAAGTKVTGAKFKKGTKPKVTVKLPKLANGKYATGKVRIYVGGKLVKTVTVKASHKGKLTVKLPKKYSKSIKVKVKYLGSSTVKAKTSTTVKLRVK